MKKLFLSLFVAGSLTFGLQSCGDPCDDVTCDAGYECVDGDCVATSTDYDCTECGTYDATATGNLVSPIPGNELDTTFTDSLPLVLVADFIQSGSDYSLSVDLSQVSSLLSDPIVVEGTYNTTTKLFTVSDFEYAVLGVADVVVNGTANFATSGEVTGTLDIAPADGATIEVTGTLDFDGTQQ